MRTIGVLGGMGPDATNQLCAAITAHTPARSDADHIPVLCYSNCRIPDRTAAILHDGPSPLPELIKTGKVLEAGGADFLVIPCNTAHYYHQALSEALTVPVLHMIELTARQTRARLPAARRVGLLATSGTVATRIYHKHFEAQAFEVLVPWDDEQEKLVMGAIYGDEGIKAGARDMPRQLLRAAAAKLIERGAEAVIAGCTEIPLVLDDTLDVPLINPTDVLARAAVNRAREVLA